MGAPGDADSDRDVVRGSRSGVEIGAGGAAGGGSLRRRVIGWGIRGAIAFVMLCLLGWAVLAIMYSDLHGGEPRKIAGLLFGVGTGAVAVFVRPWRRGLAVYGLAIAAVMAWWFSIKPSNDRSWLAEHGRAPRAEIDGDIVTIRDIRNFAYTSEDEFTPAYYDKTYDLRRLRSVDYITSFWGPKAIAHSFISFGFEGDEYVAISIETRKEQGEHYSAIEGFFRQYELIYIIGDERDLIGLRTNHRGEDVYLYRMRTPLNKTRAVFLDYMKSANELAERPRFYNALTANCVTGLFGHLRCHPPIPPFRLEILLNGYSAAYAYEHGGLDRSLPFEELQARSHINAAAVAANDAADFSRRIREGLPAPAPHPDVPSQ